MTFPLNSTTRKSTICSKSLCGDTPAGVHLRWEIKKEREAWRDLREGAYMLRTNLQADSARTDVVHVHATDRSRGLVSCARE